jgi:hypothetical protein
MHHNNQLGVIKMQLLHKVNLPPLLGVNNQLNKLRYNKLHNGDNRNNNHKLHQCNKPLLGVNKLVVLPLGVKVNIHVAQGWAF